jgi:hypothetical protein
MTVQKLSLSIRISMLLVFVFGVWGCTYGKVILKDETGSVSVEVDKGPEKGSYETSLPKIPRGHMPPPGKCRIWYPGRPPGQQPPPGDCEILRWQVPPGAWLIRG